MKNYENIKVNPFESLNSDFWVKIEKFKKEGLSKLVVISDFDGTLIQKTPEISSLIAILRHPTYSPINLTSQTNLQTLYQKYNTLIKDIPDENTKNSLANEWWQKVYDILIQAKLRKQDILSILDKALDQEIIKLQGGVVDTLKFFTKSAVPVVIFSASGLGNIAIEKVLEYYKISQDNILVISNELNFDNDRYFVGVDKDIIHSENKTLAFLQKNSELKNLLDVKPNQIVLGDAIGDIKMGNAQSLKISLDPKSKEGYDGVLNSGNLTDLLSLLI